jgi:hypothetical protein
MDSQNDRSGHLKLLDLLLWNMLFTLDIRGGFNFSLSSVGKPLKAQL